MSFENFWDTYQTAILLTAVLVIAHFSVFKLLLPRIEYSVVQSKLKSSAFATARTALAWISLATLAALVTFVWGFDIGGLMTLSASIVALLGVALFAGWSILANVTAFFLLIFHKHFRRGNYIRIISGDNYAEGYISEITLFSTRLTTEDRETIVYPNIQVLQNPSIINPKEHSRSVGKVTELSPKQLSQNDD